MPRWAVVALSVAAGVAVLVGLGVLLTGGDEGAEPTESNTLLVTIRDGEPVGGIQQLTVEQGETVSIRVVSDVAEELHVHGYDLTSEIEPEGMSEIEFEATLPGRFEIELEESGTPVAELEVRP